MCTCECGFLINASRVPRHPLIDKECEVWADEPDWIVWVENPCWSLPRLSLCGPETPNFPLGCHIFRLLAIRPRIFCDSEPGACLFNIMICIYFFCSFFFFLAIPCGLWDLSSPTEGWTPALAVKVKVLATGLPGNSLIICTSRALYKFFFN